MRAMATIYLLNGGTTIVDDEDYWWAKEFGWAENKVTGYVCRRGPDGKTVYLHRMIMEPCEPFYVDHRNGDKKDNRSRNLRLCTPSENAWNRRKGKWTGTKWESANRKWRAVIRHGGKSKYLGIFGRREDAKAAYEAAARLLRGEFHRQETF